CMIAVGRQLDERSGGRHRGSGEGISAPACNRAGESDCTLMVVAGGNAVERSFRRDLFAVQAESPAIDASVETNCAAVHVSDSDRGIGSRRRTEKALAPADGIAAGSQSARMQIACTHVNERSCRHGELAVFVVTPAHDRAVVAKTARVRAAGRDARKVISRRHRFAEEVCAPADNAAVSLQCARVLSAGGDLHERTGRWRRYSEAVPSPAHDGPVDAQRTAVCVARSDLREVAVRWRGAAALRFAPAYKRAVGSQCAGMVITRGDLRELPWHYDAQVVRRETAPAVDASVIANSAYVVEAGGDVLEAFCRHVAFAVAGIAPARRAAVGTQRAACAAAGRHLNESAAFFGNSRSHGCEQCSRDKKRRRTQARSSHAAT